MADHNEVAARIVDAANMYGRETARPRYSREEVLIRAIAGALQDAFDLGFKAAGGSVIPLTGLKTGGRDG